MAFKLELEQWQSACEAFDTEDYDTALKIFITMADTAKIHFNVGSLFTVLNDHKRAITAFNRAITKDTYFAVAYLQRGVSLFLLGDLEGARNDFDRTYQHLRGNQIINYQQLGLHFKLYSCEVLFNRGICQLYLGNMDLGLKDLYHAQKAKQTSEHHIIDEAVRARGKGFSVYSIPPGLLFRPSEFRLQQIKGLNIFDTKTHTPESTLPIVRKNSVIVKKPSSSSSAAAAAAAKSDNKSDDTKEPFDSMNISQPNSERTSVATSKLKIKCHYTDTRILLVPSFITVEDLIKRICEKFNVPETIHLLYKNESDQKQAIKNNEDLLDAINISKSRKKNSSVEKLEIWCHL